MEILITILISSSFLLIFFLFRSQTQKDDSIGSNGLQVLDSLNTNFKRQLPLNPNVVLTLLDNRNILIHGVLKCYTKTSHMQSFSQHCSFLF